jgi:hypothetical protein
VEEFRSFDFAQDDTDFAQDDILIVIPSEYLSFDQTKLSIPTEALIKLSFRPKRSGVEESLRFFDSAQDDIHSAQDDTDFA